MNLKISSHIDMWRLYIEQTDLKTCMCIEKYMYLTCNGLNEIKSGDEAHNIVFPQF